MKGKWRDLIAGVSLALILAAGTALAQTEQDDNTAPAQTELAAGTALAQNDLDDGIYYADVTLSGGSGRASVQSPAEIRIENGEAAASLIFSSPYYDYLLLDGNRYEPVNTEGNSVFEIPLSGFDCEIPVTADTTAMSVPHEIDYTLYFDSSTLTQETEAQTEEPENAQVESTEGEQEEKQEKEQEEEQEGTDLLLVDPGEDFCGLSWERSLPLQYATQFTVDYYEGGYARIVIAGEDVFLVVPEGADVPEDVDADVTVLQQPVTNIYLVATSAMDFFCSLDALDAIRLSGTDADGWYVDAAREAMEDGSILYAGKYSAPDYERILAEDCHLAIESTMIYHNPEVQEKLEGFGIPVLVERSSYESHPMGRTEWMKLYAVLLGREEEAEEIFDAQVQRVREIETDEPLGETVAFFYITSSGTANVRKSNDYLAKMIELAGGTYVFQDLGEEDSAVSTVDMTMEEFYAAAKDADCIIYNSTIDGEIYTISDLLGESALLADFKAVQEGNAWCTGKNLFQETTSLGDVIVDIHTILTEEDPEESLTYLHRLTAD